MGDTLDKAVARRRLDTGRPCPSWTELLAKLATERPDEHAAATPRTRDWRDVVADMIVGRR